MMTQRPMPLCLRFTVGASLVVCCAVTLSGCRLGEPAAPGASPSASTSRPIAHGSPAAPFTNLPPGPDDDSAGNAPSAPPAREAQRTAEAFAHAWARPDVPAATWLAGVQPYAVPNYAKLLASVNPANIPASQVTGAATALSSTTAVVVFAVPTNAGTLAVTCNLLADQWLVSTVELRR